MSYKEEYLKGMRFMLSHIQKEIAGCKTDALGSEGCGKCSICNEGYKLLKNTEKRLNEI